MEEQQQIVRRGREGFVHLRDLRRILAREARSRCDAAVHADALGVVAVPLAPAVAFAALDIGP